MYSVSPSSLSLLENCQRCFWLSVVRKIRRPSSPMPSIINKFDSIVKNYFDRYRALGELPPIIAGQIKGRLSLGMPKVLRYEKEGIVVWGRPDDYLDLEDETTVVYDHKTRAEPPTEVHPSHRLQMDVYTYLLHANNYRTTNMALIGYYFPDDCDLHDGLRISCRLVEVKTNLDRVNDLLVRASDVLNGPMPAPGENCGYCQWVDQLRHIPSRMEDNAGGELLYC